MDAITESLIQYGCRILFAWVLLDRLASLLMSKFVPGLQTIAPPTAGLLGVSFWHFVVAEYGTFSALALGLVVSIWLVWKLMHRQLFLRSLRGSRVAPLSGALAQWLALGLPMETRPLEDLPVR